MVCLLLFSKCFLRLNYKMKGDLWSGFLEVFSKIFGKSSVLNLCVKFECWKRFQNFRAWGMGGGGGVSHFWIICPIWMNNSSLESCYVVLFKYYAIEHHSCDTCARVSYFSVISGKIRHVASFNLIWRLIAKFSEKKIGNVQCILEEVLIYFCVGWILFWVS